MKNETIEYDKKDDKVILDNVAKCDTLAEAFRVSAEVIAKEHGKNTTPQKLQSRYYSYIKPHYIEGKESLNGGESVKPEADKVVSSSGISEPMKPKVAVVISLASKLEEEDQMQLLEVIWENLGS